MRPKLRKYYVMKKLLCCLFVAMFCGTIYALNAPTLSSPDDSLVVGVCRIGFQWSVVSDAKYYRLEVDTTKTFDSPVCRVFADLTTTNEYYLTYYVYDLYFDRAYHWRVKAFNADKSDESAWSPIRTFTTPKTVTLAKDDAPSPTGTFYPRQTLFWRSIRGSSGYDIEWDTVPTFNSKVYKKYQCSISQSDEDTQLSYAISNLYFNSMYYWRVRAYNKVDTTVWSETRSFHTLWKVNPKSPDSTTVTGFTQQTFYWVDVNGYPGITKYELQVDTVPTFDSPYLIKSTSSSDGTTVSYMPFNHDIYWRVRNCHQNDTSLWSNVWSFTTASPVATPKLKSPDDATSHACDRVQFIWNKVANAGKYQVEVDTTALFNSPFRKSTQVNDSTATFTNMRVGATYYWHVRAYSAADATIHSAWSEVRSFTAIKMEPLEVSKNIVFCEGDSAQYRGKWYFAADEEIINAEGETRDTIITVMVKVNPATSSTQALTVTYGTQETWHGHNLAHYAVGQYELVDTITNIAGCDSVVTLVLTVEKLSVVELSQALEFCEGDSAQYRGKWYFAAGEEIINAEGETCDTVITVTVSLLRKTSSIESKTIIVGAEETWKGYDLSVYPAGKHEVNDTTVNAAGCDSIVTLLLTVTPVWKVTLVQPEHGVISCVEDIVLDQVIDQTVLHFTAFPDENYQFDAWIGCNADGLLVVTEDVTVTCTFKEIDPTAVEQTKDVQSPGNYKLIKNGQLFIMRDGKIYNAQGIKVK